MRKLGKIAIIVIAIILLTLYVLVMTHLLRIVGDEMRVVVLLLMVIDTIVWILLLVKK